MNSDTFSKKMVSIIVPLTALVLSAVFCLGLWMFGSLWAAPHSTAAVQDPAAAPGPDPAPKVTMAADYGRLPLYFIANQGQADRRVRYYVENRGQTTFFTRDEIVLSLARPHSGPAAAKPGRRPHPDPDLHRAPGSHQPTIVRIKLRGLKKGVNIAALDQTAHRVNYFIGKDPKQWRTNIPTYQAVVYREAYKGIDIKYYGQARQLEYDIIVQPGADPDQVRFAYQGVKKLEITPAGDLTLHLPDGGTLLQKKPVVYQEVAGHRIPVAGKYRLCREGAGVTCGFDLAAYDKKHPLVIDPVLVYSSYLPAGSANGIAVDTAGATYIVGNTAGYGGASTFPITPQAYQKTYGGGYRDVFVTKLSPAGTSLVYSTFLGGDGLDEGKAIAVDANGAACVTGNTDSSDFPRLQAYQDHLAGFKDAFIAKLCPEGNALVYSTYLGGDSLDEGMAIAVDPTGNAYITGLSYSDKFPTTPQSYREERSGFCDAFVTKISLSGSLVYSTYLGGVSDVTPEIAEDAGFGIAVDNAGHAYVTGQTLSYNFPVTPGAYQEIPPLSDVTNLNAFVTKLNPEGNNLVYSTYLGGKSDDWGTAIAVDASGAANVCGITGSDNFPTRNAYQGTFVGGGTYPADAYDTFVTKLNPEGTNLVYSTYLGGNSADWGNAIAVDKLGAAYVAGHTRSTDFPRRQPLRDYFSGGELDAFVTKFTPAGNTLDYSTYLGGSGNEEATGIAVGAARAVYVTGEISASGDFPWQPPLPPLTDINGTFITKLRDVAPVPLNLLLEE